MPFIIAVNCRVGTLAMSIVEVTRKMKYIRAINKIYIMKEHKTIKIISK